MNYVAWAGYLGGLLLAAGLAAAGLALGLPVYAGLAVVCGAVFGVAGPFVLDLRRRRPAARRRRPRPVRRR